MFNIHRLSYLQYLTSLPNCLLSVRFHGTYKPELLLAPHLPAAVKFAQTVARKRGGQNLTHRDIRLSESIRQKQAFSRVDVPETHIVARSSAGNDLLAQGDNVAPGPSKPSVKTFQGLVIPEKPRPPEADECCMSGCAICVYDLYLTSFEAYQEDIVAIRSRLQAQNIPDSQWPGELRANEGEKDGPVANDLSSELDVSMSAFAELERTLRESQRNT